MKIVAMLSLLALCICAGCQRKKENKSAQTMVRFDKTQWLIEKDQTFPYRDLMLKDLIDNVQLKGLKKNEVVDLLGNPSRVDSNYLFYTIYKKRLGNTMIILHTKTLVLKIGEDSTVEWRKIHD